ncbi:Dysbindin [Stylophora pistillata]|uniref:Dysbindin n=1 Tax=Stylophora pistillata TaxID=50429 RepID=A0A2B4T343_STYPI|nr:Dysbindin [Stylophora pistillata]
MFDNFRDRLQTVQHDLTQGWKSIADKAKAVNKKIVRRTTFITDEVIESGDQCFSCNLEAGSEILSKFQREWAELHEASRECAEKGERADQSIAEFSKKCSELHTNMTMFHAELALLPEVIKNIETAKADIGDYLLHFDVEHITDAFGGQIEVLDNLMIDLEEVCEQLDLERRKAAQRLKLSKLRHNREEENQRIRRKTLRARMRTNNKLNPHVMPGELQLAKERNEVKIQQLERQASIEKRQVYEDAFLEQMNYYIQHGRTEEPISLVHGRSSGSLDDIMLEDNSDMDKELDDFFGSEAERSDAPEGKDKEQTFVGLSSEDEELLNQKLPGVSTTFNTENGAEKKVDYSVKWIGPLKDLLAMGIIMVKDKVKNL